MAGDRDDKPSSSGDSYAGPTLVNAAASRQTSTTPTLTPDSTPVETTAVLHTKGDFAPVVPGAKIHDHGHAVSYRPRTTGTDTPPQKITYSVPPDSGTTPSSVPRIEAPLLRLYDQEVEAQRGEDRDVVAASAGAPRSRSFGRGTLRSADGGTRPAPITPRQLLVVAALAAAVGAAVSAATLVVVYFLVLANR